MAEELDDGEFWLPSQFLTEEDILMDFKGTVAAPVPELTPCGSSNSLTSDSTTSPVDYSSSSGSGSGKAESEDEDEFFAALTQRVCRSFFPEEDFSSDDSPKESNSPTSPQSTLRPVSVHSEAGSNDVWGCGFSSDSPNGSVSPPPTASAAVNGGDLYPQMMNESTLEKLNVALKEMARLSLVTQQQQQQQQYHNHRGTGFFDSSRGAPPMMTGINNNNYHNNRYAAVAPVVAPIYGVPPRIPDVKEQQQLRELVPVLQNQIRGQLQAIEIMKSQRRLKTDEMSRSKTAAAAVADRRSFYQPHSDLSSRLPSPKSSNRLESLTKEPCSDSRPPLGLPPSAWPPLQPNHSHNQQQQTPQPQQPPSPQPQQQERRPIPQSRPAVPLTRPIFPTHPVPVWLGARESVGGTGVFIPQRPIPGNSARGGVSNQNQPPRKNVGNNRTGSVGSTGQKSQKIVQNQNTNNSYDYNKLDWSVSRPLENNNDCAGFGFRRIINNNNNNNVGGSQSHGMGEIELPAEWSY